MRKLTSRFSLRTLFVVLTLIAAYLGAWDATKRFGVSHDTETTTVIFDDDSTVTSFVREQWTPGPFVVLGNETMAVGDFPDCFPDYQHVAFVWLFGTKIRIFPPLPTPLESPTNKSLAKYTERIRLNSTDVIARLRRGRISLRKGENEKALADFNETIKLDPNNAPALTSRGIIWSSRGEYDKALDELTMSIRLDPNESEAYIARADIWVLQEAYDSAIDDLSEAIRLNPTRSETYVERASIWIKQDNLVKAFWDVNDALRLDPTSLSAQRTAEQIRQHDALDE